MSGLLLSKQADGATVVTGRTYDYKELLKAAGGRWDSAARAWTLPASADLSPFAALQQRTVRRSYSGRCCSAAVPTFDDENPQGPMIYRCAEHGSHKSSYCGT